jgi:hypothetical protein
MKGFRTPSWFRGKGLSGNSRNKLGMDKSKTEKVVAKKKALKDASL